jgi:ribosomal protein L44E
MLVLRCDECSSRSDDGRGWIAVIVDDEGEPDVGAYVVTYCPACAKREFGFVGRLPRSA